MRSSFVLAVLVAALGYGALGCGNEIGDKCVTSADCSPDGDRTCDSTSKGGYCTIRGCDYNTCPEESACIRFFTGNFTNRSCDPATEDVATDDCSLDELCSIVGKCVPRNSEVRFCMKTCDSSDDCRDGYECRDRTLMREHGGEPVLSPGTPSDGSRLKFCAAKPA